MMRWIAALFGGRKKRRAAQIAQMRAAVEKISEETERTHALVQQGLAAVRRLQAQEGNR